MTKSECTPPETEIPVTPGLCRDGATLIGDLSFQTELDRCKLLAVNSLNKSP